MRFLLDKDAGTISTKHGAFPDYVRGQLLTPLTRYNNWGGEYAIDNGAFSRFDSEAFMALVTRERPARDRCLFLALPDIVGNAKRTLEVFWQIHTKFNSWPLALVAQDGIEDEQIPWSQFKCLFIGGTDGFKESKVVIDLIKTAKILDHAIHVGRVNTIRRWSLFDELGADTCDGTGVSRYDWVLERIAAGDRRDYPLFTNGQTADVQATWQ